jgi:hypothetical protein
MSATLSLEERLNLVTRGQKLVNPGDIDSLESLLATTKRPKIAWGGLPISEKDIASKFSQETTPTGKRNYRCHLENVG